MSAIRRERMNAEIRSATRSMVHNLEHKRLLPERDSAKLGAMNPDRVLERGFTALETPEGEVIPRLQTLLGEWRQEWDFDLSRWKDPGEILLTPREL